MVVDQLHCPFIDFLFSSSGVIMIVLVFSLHRATRFQNDAESFFLKENMSGAMTIKLLAAD